MKKHFAMRVYLGPLYWLSRFEKKSLALDPNLANLKTIGYQFFVEADVNYYISL